MASLAQQGQPQIGIAAVTLSAGPYTFDTAEQHKIRVVVVARGLVHPFSLAFLPNGDALVTERGTKLRIVRNATGPQRTPVDPDAVAGLPAFPPFRTGGLQEVALHPQFATNRLVYFTYNKAGAVGANPNQRQSAITLARGRFDGKALTNVEELFIGDWNSGASGSRLAFSRAVRLHDDRRAVRREGAKHRHRLRKGSAPHRGRKGPAGQSVRRKSRARALKCSRWGIAISWG